MPRSGHDTASGWPLNRTHLVVLSLDRPSLLNFLLGITFVGASRLLLFDRLKRLEDTSPIAGPDELLDLRDP